jgi:hypothetical protein
MRPAQLEQSCYHRGQFNTTDKALFLAAVTTLGMSRDRACQDAEQLNTTERQIVGGHNFSGGRLWPCGHN